MTDRLFKFGSLEDELMKGMENKLSDVQKPQKISKVAKAFDYLSTAAELFDDAGRTKEAEVITKLIEKLAKEPNIIDKLIDESLSGQNLSDQFKSSLESSKPLDMPFDLSDDPKSLADELEPEEKEVDLLADLLEPSSKKKV